LIVEFFLAGKFVWREQAVLDRLYRSDALAETADVFPEGLVFTYDTVEEKVNVVDGPPTPFTVPLPKWYKDSLHCVMSYIGIRFGVDGGSLLKLLPEPEVQFARSVREQRRALLEARNKRGARTLSSEEVAAIHRQEFFGKWITIVTNSGTPKGNHPSPTKSKVNLLGTYLTVGFTSPFNQVYLFMKMFCKREMAGKKGHRYLCSKEVVQKQYKERAGREASVPAAYLASVPAGLAVVLTFSVVSFLEAMAAVALMTLPAAIVCSIALRHAERARPPAASIPLCRLVAGAWRLCCHSYTLYALVWAVTGDWITIIESWGWRKKGPVGGGRLMQDSFALYALWTMWLCRMAALPVVLVVRVVENEGGGTEERQAGQGERQAGPRERQAERQVGARERQAGPRERQAERQVGPRERQAGQGERVELRAGRARAVAGERSAARPVTVRRRAVAPLAPREGERPGRGMMPRHPYGGAAAGSPQEAAFRAWQWNVYASFYRNALWELYYKQNGSPNAEYHGSAYGAGSR
jgi:hypothetical protein